MKHAKPPILFLTLAIIASVLPAKANAPATCRAVISFYSDATVPSYEEMDKAVKAINVLSKNSANYKYAEAFAEAHPDDRENQIYININAIYQDTVILEIETLHDFSGSAFSVRGSTLKVNLKTGTVLHLEDIWGDSWEPEPKEFKPDEQQAGAKAADAKAAPALLPVPNSSETSGTGKSACATLPAAAKPQEYFNEEFGIKFPIPAKTWLFPIPPEQHDHGPVLKLEKPDDNNPQHLRDMRRIDVFAFFNAIDDTSQLDDFFKAYTKSDCGAPEYFPAPEGVSIANLKYKAGLILWPHGWVDVILATQAGEPIESGQGKVPSVNYLISLHTRTRNLEADLKPFRELLKTIQLTPPPASYWKRAGEGEGKGERKAEANDITQTPYLRHAYWTGILAVIRLDIISIVRKYL